MPQIHVTLDKYLADNYCNGAGIDVFFQDLIPVVEKRFGIEGKDDVAITVVSSIRTIGEANIQVEIRYTAGADEYKTGRVFDPPVKVLNDLIEDIHKEFLTFSQRNRSSPPLSLSVWCKPYRDGAFEMFK